MKKLLLCIAVALLCKSTIAQNIGVIPTPQNIEIKQGVLEIKNSNILLYHQNDEAMCRKLIQKTLTSETNNLMVTYTTNKKELRKSSYPTLEIRLNPQLSFPANPTQGYVLDITSKGITIEAISEQGLYYGLLTLKQLINKALLDNPSNVAIPCMKITDYPTLEYRGWLDDISRGPIPNMEFFKKEIRTMAEYKMNFFNLYTEHVFKLLSHPDIAPADGISTAEVKELIEYAKEYYMDFVGNQQCFAHAEKTLSIPYYKDITDTRYNLNPATEKTYRFLEEQFAEVAPAFESQYFNINCDETESLGSGRAGKYVDSVGGTDNAYCLHINRVYDILQKYNKTVLMWGDIITKNPEMINKLPKDMQFIVWSYVAADNFDEHIRPIQQSKHTFWIAPGMSMWSTVFPLVDTYIKNIGNLVKDGHQAGTKGMMNTAWDDSGESLFNSAWHGMAWSAEMSWNPIVADNIEQTDSQRKKRETTFNTNFNTQYFGTSTNATALIYAIGNLGNNPDVGEWMNTGSLHEPLLDFYPSKVDSSMITRADNVLALTQNLLKECNKIIADNSIANKDIFLNARYAVKRIAATAMKNKLRVQLYNTYCNPSQNNIAQSKAGIEELFQTLKELKYDYLLLWDYECRQYSREIVTNRYDDFARELLEAENHVFINTELSAEGTPVISLKTIYADRPIYYTTDGGKPSSASKQYSKAFEISNSCLVKTIAYNQYGDNKQNERYILYHKGMGHLKQLNTKYSTYNATYSAGGDNALLDGKIGSDNTYADGHWQGYWGVDIDVEMDFGKPTAVNSVSMRFLQNTYNWILAPYTIEIYTSTDGKNYKLIKQENLQPKLQLSGCIVNPVSVRNVSCTTRYLRVVAKNPGKLPSWHPAKGNDSYLFVDEIVVE